LLVRAKLKKQSSLAGHWELKPRPWVQSGEDHAAYIANWLDVLKTDNRAIFAAASHAQRAADFINGLQPASAG
jgi:antirestriction protein ArdC